MTFSTLIHQTSKKSRTAHSTNNKQRKARQSLTIGAVLMGTLIASGCRVADNINVKDGHTAAYHARLIVRPEAMKIGQRHQGGIEASFSAYRGVGTQSLDSTESIGYEQAYLLGPQVLSHDLQLDIGRVAYNAMFRIGKHLEIEPSIGLSYMRTKVNSLGSVTGAQRFTTKQRSVGMSLAVTPRWNFNRFVGLEAGIGGGLGHHSGTAEYRLGAVARPTSSLAFRAGYYNRAYGLEMISDPKEAPIEAHLSGFFGELGLQF